MKKIIAIVVLILVSNVLFAQTVFDKYDGQDGVTSIVVNKKMFQMMSSVKVDANDKETQQYLSLIKKLDNLKVFTTTNTKLSADMKSTTEKYVKTAGLEELMRVNDGGKNVRILVKSGSTDNQVKELLMFIENASKQNETVLMSLTGSFDLSEIAILTDKMKIPGGDDLKKATKGK
jgi:pantothenate kinase-related protein Tda10